MEFSYSDHEYSRGVPIKTDGSSSSSSEHNNNNNNDQELGMGRSYECVFCKRGFNTAQALGGHMNIHRKDKKANNKNKHTFIIPPPSSLSSDDYNNNINYYADLGVVYSAIPRGNNSNNTKDANSDRQGGYFGAAAGAPDWKQRNLSLYSSNNPSSCVRQVIKDKVQENKNNTDEDGLDLELRLGHHHRP